MAWRIIERWRESRQARAKLRLDGLRKAHQDAQRKEATVAACERFLKPVANYNCEEWNVANDRKKNR